MRIAVLRPNHRLGNTVLLNPLVQELERRFPEARIELVTACGAAPALYRQFPCVGTTYTFPGISWRHPGRVLRLLWSLRRQRFDLAIDPIPRSRAGRFLLAWVRSRERLGYVWGVAIRDRPLTRRVEAARAPAHFAQAPVGLLRAAYPPEAGSSAGSPSAAVVPLELRLTAAERREGQRRLAAMLGQTGSGAQPPTLGVFANATGSKAFALEWWRQLLAELRATLPALRYVEFVPEDRRPRLAAEMPGAYTADLRLLAATLAATSLLVLADSGVLHLAEAAGAKLLGLFRTTDPARYGTLRAGSEALWALEASPAQVAERIRALLAVRVAGSEKALHVVGDAGLD